MARHYTYSEEERQAWSDWYVAAEHGRTAQQTADHFGVPVASVRRHLQATKSQREAMANDGAMSQSEYDILVRVRALIA